MDVAELITRMKADIKPLTDGLDKAKKKALDTAEKIDNALDNMGKGAGKEAQKSIDQTLKKTRSLRDELKIINQKARIEAGLAKPNAEFRTLQANIKDTTRVLEGLQRKQAATSPMTSKVTDEYDEVRRKVDALGKKFEELLDKEEEYKSFDLSNAGIKQLWDDLQTEIASTAAELGSYEEQMRQLEESGQAFKPNEKWQQLQAEIEATTAKLEEYRAKEEQMLLSGKEMDDKGLPSLGTARMKGIEQSEVIPDWLKNASGLLHAIGETAKEAGSGVSKFGALAKEALGKPIGWLAKLKSGFGSVLSRIPLLGKAVTGAANSFGGFIRKIIGIGFAVAIVRKAISMTREGLNNLSEYSSNTRNSLESIRSSLLTLKNALATAFAPVLNAIAPILAKLIDWCTAAATAVAHLFSALTGKSTVVIARKATSGVASGIGSVGSAADGAKGSVDELKKSLMGFDQINKLDDQSGGSGGSGGGSGGGGGAAGAGSMFETVDVSADAMNLADAIKEAWKDADFTEIGEMVGAKLNNALNSIPWDKIQETSRKIAKSIATFLNGFISETDWHLVGDTIAQGINTAIYFAETFVTTFNWGEFGKAIADTLIGAVEGIDWSALARTIGGLVGGLSKALWEALKELGAEIAPGFEEGIWEGIKGIGAWIRDNIFKPFIDGFKTAFGISSPATTMKPLGENIILGVLEGLKNRVTDIVKWFKDLPELIKGKISTITMDVTAKLTSWSDALKEKAIGFKAKLTTWSDALKDKIVSFKSKLTTWSDALKDKVTSFKAKMTTWSDSLKSKAISFKAKMATWSDDLKTKVVTFKAKLTTWQDALKNKVVTFKAKFTKLSATLKKLFGLAGGGVYKGGRWMPVTAAASGGSFNQGQVFVAREAGPELVGSIGGHTAVMNNDQIVGSVSAGVYKAVLAAMSQTSGDKGVTIVLEGDAKKMFRIMQEQARNYTNSTGLSPFPV